MAGPPARAYQRAGLLNAETVSHTVPSPVRSTTKASSPLSGCPASVPYAQPALRCSSTVHTTRQGALTTPARVTVTSTSGAARSALASMPTPSSRWSSQVSSASAACRKTGSPSPSRVRTRIGWKPGGQKSGSRVAPTWS